MARVPVIYSFHFDNGFMRVQQIRQMDMIDGGEPVSPNDLYLLSLLVIT